MSCQNFDLKKHRTWCELSETALIHNIEAVLHFIPENLRKFAVVKANAYGHDAVWVSKVALANGFSDLAVATLEEGIHLRQAGIKAPILLLNPYQIGSGEYLIQYDLSQTISSAYEAETLIRDLNISAQKRNSHLSNSRHISVKVHFKLDTGMNRIGFSVYGQETQKNLDQIAVYAKQANINPIGIFTHLAAADEPEKEFTALQFSRFQYAVKALAKRNVRFSVRHCANSAAAIMFENSHLDAVRIGILLYGCCPNVEIKEKLRLEPVMSMFSRVSAIHMAETMTTVGYGLTYTCPKPTRIATIEAGYADGVNRHLSNRGYVLINGKKAAIIGNICMDRLMLDITDLNDVKIGDEVLIFGRDHDENYLDLDKIAKLADTISYEMLCQISNRVPKIYIS